EGRVVGQRCPACGKVYVPPRGACPTDGVPTTTDVELPDVGTVTTFCVVNVPFQGQRVPTPYVAASVLLDGADIAFQHLILGCDPAEVRMGMRVRAVWKPREEWGTTSENISHFEPAGEPDAPYESYARHL
ncbi:MAG TPA: Zn-ribbon domain-containing OB-fold protein, partial [Streptosporangiaceae bacterium]|nr:Zn-ribbon domain-containing OB-fold protein [Streptosporangiaceae bacterium]